MQVPEEWRAATPICLTERYIPKNRFIHTPRYKVVPRSPLAEQCPDIIVTSEDECTSTSSCDEEVRSQPSVPSLVPKLKLEKNKNRTVTAQQIMKQKQEAKEELKKLIEQNVDISSRIKLLEEILTSEQNYIRNLDLLWKMYYGPLVEKKPDPYQKNRFDTPGDIPNAAKMFPPNLSTVMTINQAFLKKLTERYELYDEESMYFLMIGDLFIEMAPFFKVYVTYLSAYERSMTIIRRNRKSRSFSRWLDRRKKLPDSHGLDIGSLLITVVQRLPRYQLLLKNLLDLTQPDHVDYYPLVEAHELVSGIADFQNKRIRESNNAMEIAKLGARLKIPDLVKPTRRMIYTGEFMMMERKCVGHLFNDILLIEEPRPMRRPKCTEYHLFEAFIAGGDVDTISLRIDSETNIHLKFEMFNDKIKWSDAISKVLLELQERETEESIKFAVEPPKGNSSVRVREPNHQRRLSVNMQQWKSLLTPRRRRNTSYGTQRDDKSDDGSAGNVTDRY
jgi:hypothetical protein